MTRRILLICIICLTFVSSAAFAHDNCERNLDKPLSDPLYSTVYIRNWAAQAVTETMTLTFADHKQRLQDASNYFTRTGWEKYLEAFDRSGQLKNIIEQKQVMTSVIKGTPIIIKEGLVSTDPNLMNFLNDTPDNYTWTVEIPVLTSYQQGDKVMTTTYIIRVVIIRSAHPNNPDHIGITQLIARRAE